MARITVEDVVERVENRFELIVLAAHRARRINKGSVQPLIPGKKEKPVITVLREIESGLIGINELREDITKIDFDEHILDEFKDLQAGMKAGVNEFDSDEDLFAGEHEGGENLKEDGAEDWAEEEDEAETASPTNLAAPQEAPEAEEAASAPAAAPEGQTSQASSDLPAAT